MYLQIVYSDEDYRNRSINKMISYPEQLFNRLSGQEAVNHCIAGPYAGYNWSYNIPHSEGYQPLADDTFILLRKVSIGDLGETGKL